LQGAREHGTEALTHSLFAAFDRYVEKFFKIAAIFVGKARGREAGKCGTKRARNVNKALTGKGSLHGPSA